VKRFLGAAAGLVTLIVLQASALSVGDKAPDFTLSTTTDSLVTFSQAQGQVRVLFFFGCG
jgi:peroxiredoxin